MRCDVLIVGAGPAGSSAAYACAEAGLDVILIEKKKNVGIPVSCSGAVGSYLIPFLPFKVPKGLLEYKIEGLEFNVDDLSFTRRGGPWTSYAIDRTSFDVWLSERAVKRGAALHLETEFMDFKYNKENNPNKAVVKKKKEEFEIDFRVLIGCDGSQSRVLERIGKKEKVARLGKAVVYEYEGVNIDSTGLDQLYYGDFAPGGYAHIFPISENRANVGVGSIKPETDIKNCFERFVSLPRVQRQLRGAKKIREKSGVVSFDRLSKSRQYGNILFAGEAASQNIKPLVEGFFPSIICGDVAGKTAARSLLKKDSLENYQRNLDRKLGVVLRESEKLVGMLEEISDLEGVKSYLLLAALSGNVFSLSDVNSLMGLEAKEIRKRILQWKKSRWKQILSLLSEGLGVYYLHTQRWLGSKVYKL